MTITATKEIKYWCGCGEVAAWFATQNVTGTTESVPWFDRKSVAACDTHLVDALRKLTDGRFSVTIREERTGRF